MQHNIPFVHRRLVLFVFLFFSAGACSSSSSEHAGNHDGTDSTSPDSTDDTNNDENTDTDEPDTQPVINDPSQSGLVFSHSRGFYESAFDLTIDHPTAEEVIYTMDSGDPTRSPNAITAALPLVLRIDPLNTENRYLAPGVVVRAMPKDDTPAYNKVSTHTYLFASRVSELSPDGQRPGDGWPEPGEDSAATNGQWINYGMDPNVTQDPDYADQLVDAMLDIPSVSLVTDLDYLFDRDYGIFVNALMRAEDPDPLTPLHAWERAASVEFLYPDKPGVQANTGIRIRGGVSRNDNNPKHAFKCYFRGMYGVDKLHYPLFDDEGAASFDRLDFRTSNNYSWSFDGTNKNTMNRDVFSRDLQKNLARPYTRSRYYHLYLDGVYWGLFQSQERVDADYVVSYLGGKKDNIDVIKTTREDESTLVIEAADGTDDSWQELWRLSEAGFQNDEAYFALEGKDANGERDFSQNVFVDIDNLIDYMLIIFFTGNFDAPVSKFFGNRMPNNFYAAVDRTSMDSGFVFFAHDNEHSLRIDEDWVTEGVAEDRVNLNSGTNMDMSITRYQDFNPQWLHYRLTENEHYRSRFAARAATLLQDDGPMTPDAAIALFDRRADEINLAIIGESARWGDAQGIEKVSPWGDSVTGPLTKNDHWLPMLERIRNEFFEVRSEIVIEQLKDAGLF